MKKRGGIFQRSPVLRIGTVSVLFMMFVGLGVNVHFFFVVFALLILLGAGLIEGAQK